MSRSPVLTTDDLPEAELRAAALDGDLFALDRAWCPIDEFDRAALRAEVIARLWPHRLIAERRSAAWVLGALPDPPAVHELCADTEARTKPRMRRDATVREVVIDAADRVRVGSLEVTTPVRTVVDLARVEERFDDDVRAMCRSLLEIDGGDIRACRALIERRRNLPGKRRAWDRLRSL